MHNQIWPSQFVKQAFFTRKNIRVHNAGAFVKAFIVNVTSYDCMSLVQKGLYHMSPYIARGPCYYNFHFVFSFT